MEYWVFLWNKNRFDLDGSLRDLGYVFWREINKINVGDRVLIYATGKTARLTHLLEVTEVNVPASQICTDKYRLGDHDAAIKPVEHYCRLDTLAFLNPDNPNFARKNLLELGFSAKAMSNFKCNSSISAMVLDNIDELVREEDTNINLFLEGSMRMLRHKAYERSAQAREECIRQKGCKCSICGFDFEKMYGQIGRGFIEVHHIPFISDSSENGKLTNVENDLIPVCPNFHSMLHRKLEGEYATPEKLRQYISNK